MGFSSTKTRDLWRKGKCISHGAGAWNYLVDIRDHMNLGFTPELGAENYRRGAGGQRVLPRPSLLFSYPVAGEICSLSRSGAGQVPVP